MFGLGCLVLLHACIADKVQSEKKSDRVLAAVALRIEKLNFRIYAPHRGIEVTLSQSMLLPQCPIGSIGGRYGPPQTRV